MKKITAMSACLSIALIGGAQTDSTTSKKIHFRFIQIQDGPTFGKTNYINKQDFQSMLINPDPSFYFNDNGYETLTGSSYNANVGLKINTAFSIGANKSQLFKIGLGFLSASYSAYNSTKQDITRIDTLKSSQGGYAPVYLDSVVNRTYGMNTNIDILSLDLEYDIQSNEKKRFIASAGVRVSPFYSIVNNASTYNSNYRYIKLKSDDFDESGVAKYSSTNAITSKTKACYGVVLSLPMALNFKPKKPKHTFGKHSAAGFEISPDLRILKLPGQSISSQFNLTAHVSYRYYFKSNY